jgi:hypothetical protein
VDKEGCITLRLDYIVTSQQVMQQDKRRRKTISSEEEDIGRSLPLLGGHFELVRSYQASFWVYIFNL